MKKTVLAAALLVVAASGANAATIYDNDGTSIDLTGRAEGRAAIKDSNVSDESRVRLNIAGKQQIRDSLYGAGVYEVQFNTNENGGATDTDSGDKELEVRLAYAALGGDFGQVGYGKTEGGLGIITDFTDIMAYHGNTAADKFAVADRSDNMISYQGSFFDVLQLKASVRFDDTTNQGHYKDEDSSGFSASGIYNVAGLINVGGGYAEQGKNKEGMIGVNGKLSGVYLAALYTDAKKDFDSYQVTGDLPANMNNFNGVVDYKGFELATSYTVGDFAFTATYNKAETDGDTTVNNTAVDATYYFKTNFYTYASYNFNMLSEGDHIGTGVVSKADADDEIAVGIRYDF
ncbi:porin [Vibrio owensii]|uniref:Membrane protein n=1 Tax=Vibrio owensii CAIM 1854 = LMG 25443 TaxID=1229493 RepID=A0A0C1VN58_9VIBR|nr:porin [Vibrio owensii]KIF45442.1 membrane protein [Vibrio owensii CAIM 1854 = LMG 25443]